RFALATYDLHSFPTRRSSDLRELVLAEAIGTLPRAPRQAETAGSGHASSSCPALTPAGLARAPDGGPARHAHPVALSGLAAPLADRKSTRLNSSHDQISYAVF